MCLRLFERVTLGRAPSSGFPFVTCRNRRKSSSCTGLPEWKIEEKAFEANRIMPLSMEI